MPKYLDLQLLRDGDFQVFGSKWPQIRTTYLCRTQNTYGTLKERYQVNLQEKIKDNPCHLQPKTLIFTIRALVA